MIFLYKYLPRHLLELLSDNCTEHGNKILESRIKNQGIKESRNQGFKESKNQRIKESRRKIFLQIIYKQYFD